MADLRRHQHLGGLRPVPLPQPSLSLTGLTGEVLRTNYPASNALRTAEHLAQFVDAGMLGHDRAGLLQPGARAHMRWQVDTDLRALFDLTGDARDALDGYYQVGRLRRWFGVGNELDNRNRALPLYSLPTFRTAFAIGADHRRAERLPFEVLAATAPELATMAFAQRNWSPALLANVPDAGRYPTSPAAGVWHPPAASVAPAAGRGGRTRWRRRVRAATASAVPAAVKRHARPASASTVVDHAGIRDTDERIPLIRSYLDLGPDHRLYEYLDYDATMRAVTDLADLDLPARRAVFAAATAAMWLSEADLPAYDLD